MLLVFKPTHYPQEPFQNAYFTANCMILGPTS